MTQTLPSSSSPVPPSGESAPIPVDARTEDPLPDFRQQLASDRTLLAGYALQSLSPVWDSSSRTSDCSYVTLRA
jgi:hypothetical protein